jgi:hypothetical protein
MSSRPKPVGLLATACIVPLAAVALAAMPATSGHLPTPGRAAAVGEGLRQVIVESPQLLANPIVIVGDEAIRHVVVENPRLLANPIIVTGEE